MKKLFLILFLSQCFVGINAKVNYNINKHGVMFVYFYYSDSIPTINLFFQDWKTSIDIANSNPNVKQLQFMDKRENLFAWLERSQFSTWEALFNKTIDGFSSLDKYDVTYDSVYTSVRIPAEYHIDTYYNGKLESTYVSDWDGGYIAPSTSEYKSRGNTIKKKKYVKPAYIKKYWVKKATERKLIQKGVDVKLEEIYSKEDI